MNDEAQWKEAYTPLEAYTFRSIHLNQLHHSGTFVKDFVNSVSNVVVIIYIIHF